MTAAALRSQYLLGAAARWQGLPRERRSLLLTLGGVVAVILLIALVWLPLERARTAAAKRVPQLNAAWTAMQRDAEEVQRLRALPAGLAANSAPATKPLDAALIRATFPGAVVAAEAGRFRVQAEDTSFAQWLDQLKALARETGATVESARISAEGKPAGKVKLDAVLAPRGR